VTLPAFVVDFSDEQDPYALQCLDAMADARVLAPSLWVLEVADGLLGAQRRGRLTPDETAVALGMLAELDVTVEAVVPRPATLLGLAQTSNLTVYDAAYLELAIRQSVPLVTNNDALRRAAIAAGVGVWQPDTARDSSA
jgi:predicted nucleic acid-binding protein